MSTSQVPSVAPSVSLSALTIDDMRRLCPTPPQEEDWEDSSATSKSSSVSSAASAASAEAADEKAAERKVFKLKIPPMQWGKTRQAQIYAGLGVMRELGFISFDQRDDTMRDVNKCLSTVLWDTVDDPVTWSLQHMASAGFWTNVFTMRAKYIEWGEWVVRGKSKKVVDHACEAWTLDNMQNALLGDKSKNFRDADGGDGSYVSQIGNDAGRKNGFNRWVAGSKDKRRQLDVRPLGSPEKRQLKLNALNLVLREAGLGPLPEPILLQLQPEPFYYDASNSSREQALGRISKEWDENIDDREQKHTVNRRVFQPSQAVPTGSSSSGRICIGSRRPPSPIRIRGIKAPGTDSDSDDGVIFGEEDHSGIAKKVYKESKRVFDAVLDDGDTDYLQEGVRVPSPDKKTDQELADDKLRAIMDTGRSVQSTDVPVTPTEAQLAQLAALAAEEATIAAEEATLAAEEAALTTGQPLVLPLAQAPMLPGPEDPVAKLRREQAERRAAQNAADQAELEAAMNAQASACTSSSVMPSDTVSDTAESFNDNDLAAMDDLIDDDNDGPTGTDPGPSRTLEAEEDDDDDAFFERNQMQAADPESHARAVAEAATTSDSERPLGIELRLARVFEAQNRREKGMTMTKRMLDDLDWWENRLDKKHFLETGEVVVPRKKKQETPEQRIARIHRESSEKERQKRVGERKEERLRLKEAAELAKMLLREERALSRAEKEQLVLETRMQKAEERSTRASKILTECAQKLAARERAKVELEHKQCEKRLTTFKSRKHAAAAAVAPNGNLLFRNIKLPEPSERKRKRTEMCTGYAQYFANELTTQEMDRGMVSWPYEVYSSNSKRVNVDLVARPGGRDCTRSARRKVKDDEAALQAMKDSMKD